VASKAPGQRFIVWDAGIYRVEDEGQALISTATDELVPYSFAIEGESIRFTDRQGCEFSYHRLTG
jgi:hypothetical protein